jgi:hypothetical protein
MRFIVRTTFHTRPGQRDQAVAAVKQLRQYTPGASNVRMMTAMLASDGAPDIIMETEVNAEDFMSMMQQMEAMYSNSDFVRINAEFVKHLAKAAKTDLYMVEE